ncbi:MAG TPA: ankyrin repeat domain-containing protein [Pyrinomonadaceae bacterium]|nr:ankyrin repeat domain-containing protein [Chloracidobacterium sp.]HRK52224.1 ankyrin repeat domain-containing protein [Pyrinomonadaceae bacterium]
MTESVVRGELQSVVSVIESGANVNGGFDQSIPVLEVAASFGKTEVVRLLIERGADVNRTRSFGQTALKAAVIGQHPKTTEALIEKGADVCEKTEGSALQYAVEVENGDLIAILEGSGAKSCP